jgi:hypothetical protein
MRMHAPTVTKILNYVCVCVVCVMSSPEIHAAGSGGSPNMHWLSLAPAGCRRAGWSDVPTGTSE